MLLDNLVDFDIALLLAVELILGACVFLYFVFTRLLDDHNNSQQRKRRYSFGDKGGRPEDAVFDLWNKHKFDSDLTEFDSNVNNVYHVWNESMEFIVKQFNRAEILAKYDAETIEKNCKIAKVMAYQRLGPDMLGFVDGEKPLLFLEFLPDVTVMSQKMMATAARKLSSLHALEYRTGTPAVFTSMKKMINNPHMLPENRVLFQSELEWMKEEVRILQVPTVPSAHNDLSRSNIRFLCDTDVRFIDFDSYGPGFPSFDIAMLISKKNEDYNIFSRELVDTFFETYAEASGRSLEQLRVHDKLMLMLCYMESMIFRASRREESKRFTSWTKYSNHKREYLKTKKTHMTIIEIGSL